MAGIGPQDGQVHQPIQPFAEAANGEILTVQDGQLLVKYSGIESLRARHPLKSWPLTGAAVRTIAAFHAGFVILYQDGTVATTGDARFEDCLGRRVSDQSYGLLPTLPHIEADETSGLTVFQAC